MPDQWQMVVVGAILVSCKAATIEGVRSPDWQNKPDSVFDRTRPTKENEWRDKTRVLRFRLRSGTRWRVRIIIECERSAWVVHDTNLCHDKQNKVQHLLECNRLNASNLLILLAFSERNWAMHPLVNSQDHGKQPTAYCAHASLSPFASQHDNTECVQLGAGPIAEFLPVARASLSGVVGDGSTYPSQGVVGRPDCTISSGSGNSDLFEATSSRRPPVVASGPRTDDTSTIARTDHQNSSVDPASGKTRKRRPPKPRIELSSDQPLTTQGKPRSRVYLACLQW